MNTVKKIFCRSFQTVLRMAMPFLPYRDPKVLNQVQDIPGCLLEKKIESVLIVTDGFLHISGMLEPLKKALKENGIRYTIYDNFPASKRRTSPNWRNLPTKKPIPCTPCLS